ncbi:Abi family protein [Nocardia sp. NPDC049737]|uniref:Abi family protein n=1 Tax=Nocardia sp. NPDC049737 TaxID=3154358 RepID=UPI003418861B
MKPALTLDEQLRLLEGRGLSWSDPEPVKQFLHDVSYYRFTGYLRYFQRDPRNGDNTFHPGTTFEQVKRIYLFDDELRRWLFDGLCAFEVTFRARFAYEVATRLGSPDHYLDLAAYHLRKGADKPVELLKGVDRDLCQSKEPYIEKFRTAGENVPVWAAAEVCSFGTVSKMYGLIKKPVIVKAVARTLNLSPDDAPGTVQSLSVLRNICAHHGRIWNRILKVPPPIRPDLRPQTASANRRSPWAWIVVLGDQVDRIQQASGHSGASFSAGLRDYLDEYPDLQHGLKHPRST